MTVSKEIQLTEAQEQILAALKNHPGRWMSAIQIWQESNPGQMPQNRETSSLASSLRMLPKLDNQVVCDNRFKPAQYRWVDALEVDLGNTDQPQPIGPTSMPSDECSDDVFIAKALMYYANGMVAQDSGKALRAAYLAGQIGKTPGTAKNVAPWGKAYAIPSKGKHEVAPAADIAAPEVGDDEEASRIPAIMPEDMTYRELVEKVQASYKRCEFLYAVAAKRAGMGEDYFTRIAQGKVALPPRATQERVYSAIFEDELSGDDCAE